MADVLRRKWYVKDRILIETARILDPQFKGTVLSVTGAELELLRNLMMYLSRDSTFVSNYYARYYLAPTTSEWDSLLAIVANLEEKLMLIHVDDYVCVRDKKAQGVHGGAFSGGAWRVRTINDEQSDSAGICSIEGDQVTLPAGTYRCSTSVPAYKIGVHQARLWNATDSALLLLGTSEYVHASDNVVTRSVIVGSFVLAGEKALEIQHRCQGTQAVNGLGVACNMADEIYAVAEFWRMIG